MSNSPSRLPGVNPQRPPLTIPQDLEPAYSNLVRITHMPSELIFDFALKMPGNSPARVMAQVMMSPLSAKLFQRALTENLAKYEATFGEINIPGEASLTEYSKLFRPPQSPESDENPDE